MKGEVNFCCMPGVRAMFLDDQHLALVHPAMPAALVDMVTGEIEELRIDEAPMAGAVTLMNMAWST